MGLLRALDGDGGTDMNLSSGAGCRVAHNVYVHVRMHGWIYIFRHKAKWNKKRACRADLGLPFGRSLCTSYIYSIL